MKLLNFLLVLFLSLGIMACGNGEHDHDNVQPTAEEIETDETRFDVPDSFKTELESALDHYFDLSEALVNADHENAKLHVQNFIVALDEIETGELSDGATAVWNEHLERVRDNGTLLSLEDDLDNQRYHFESVSEDMISVVETFGPLTYTVYHQTCPMVRDSSADWLSKDEQILNPYHGDRMLRCGSIVREI